MLKKIMSTYIKQVERIFQKNVGSDLILKAAFEEDIGDNLVDYWSVPEGEPVEEEKIETAVFEDSDDPLIQLGNKFPEIVEYTDESEFVEYNSEENDFSQTALEEEGDEEF